MRYAESNVWHLNSLHAPDASHTLQADKLADTNQLVRQSACNVLLALAAAFSADAVRERMSRWFGHKSWRARHGVVQLFAETVERHGYERTEANINYVESALRLLEDSDKYAPRSLPCTASHPLVPAHVACVAQLLLTTTWLHLLCSTVRDATAEFLQEVYKLWGEPLLAQCQSSLRPAQLSLLYTKLEEGGLVLPADSSAEVMVVEDEGDTVMLSNMLIKGQHNSIGRGQEDFRGASDQARQASGRRGGFKVGECTPCALQAPPGQHPAHGCRMLGVLLPPLARGRTTALPTSPPSHA
jgi:hypothetical protein